MMSPKKKHWAQFDSVEKESQRDMIQEREKDRKTANEDRERGVVNGVDISVWIYHEYVSSRGRDRRAEND